MLFYGITQVVLVKEIRMSDPALLAPFYADNSASDGSVQQSARILTLLLERGASLG